MIERGRVWLDFPRTMAAPRCLSTDRREAMRALPVVVIEPPTQQPGRENRRYDEAEDPDHLNEPETLKVVGRKFRRVSKRPIDDVDRDRRGRDSEQPAAQRSDPVPKREERENCGDHNTEEEKAVAAEDRRSRRRGDRDGRDQDDRREARERAEEFLHRRIGNRTAPTRTGAEPSLVPEAMRSGM